MRRARLAELETGFTMEKAQVEAMKARLFARLRGHFQRRDRLRLVIDYRRKVLESRERQGGEVTGKIALEIIRVLEAGHALKDSPDYEMHRLTTRTPSFFDETVVRHVESLEKEAGSLEREAEELAKEIKELKG